ncbi:MAG TPA: GNAT family N-acetyltransferase, partial [Candidatus Angelobacter sp.]|nr:GNAT family N-acetyltransferase [Candidatus Angelobacter sp.]
GKVGTLEAIPFAVDELINRGYSFPSVIGRADLSEAFAAHYSQKTDQSYSVEMSQRIYRLDRVIPPKKQDGHLRVVEEKDIQQVAKWILAFDQEAVGGTLTEERALDRAKRGASQRDLFVWELEGDLVAMAGASRATSNAITISLVYTPPQKRGKGFASNCVAALSQILLDQGYTYCTLYTDLMNSTSNKIYQQIGYEPVNDSMVYRFN